ncbi:hypothetical protein DICPUDRAFT_157204 [Dictyostelium purpureum]|uniref:F-box domain-containing protein n=1 Tax=Dictyostelium purpureum TaxID=5786 RepID=F0ZYJ2_DICPU|nr:uncharacterized protein DICPUDRAFT_157204 [Dictyostelium purpureum]EGC30983.1 hypothetical protein DICPUDRAFT_157204 [Dictyostelium purpureum]|eukprot:XP_003292484.1 hypothetical protein DICPUDRAFT_157204 [Dictyostelium purpureum]
MVKSMELVDLDNFDIEKICDYLLCNKGEYYDEYGQFVPKNKSKNRFFQSFIDYLDFNNETIYPTKQQLENIFKIFVKLKGYDSFKYYEMIVFSSYENYLYFNYGNGDNFEKIITEWVEYGLKMNEYHRWHGIYNDNEYHNLLFDQEIKNVPDIEEEEDKEDDPHEEELKRKCFSYNNEGVIRFFIYLGYPLEIKIKEGQYLEYISLLVELSTLVKRNEPLSRTDSYYKTYTYYLYLNTNEALLSLISITPFIQSKLYDQILSIIYRDPKLFINYGNQFSLIRDFNETIETLLKLDEFNFQVMLDFIRFFLDNARGNYSNKKEYYEKYKIIHFKEEICRVPLLFSIIDTTFPDNILKKIVCLLLNDFSTMQIRKLNLALVCKKFYYVVKENMNNSTTIPIDIGECIYNIKEDNFHNFSLLNPNSVKFLCYSVSKFIDPSLSVLKIFKNLQTLEIHGMTELDANSIAILDSIKSLKSITIKSIPFYRFCEFFRGFRDLYGYLKDQYLENKNDYEYCQVDLNSYPKEFNIKKQSFEDFTKENCGKNFYIHLYGYNGRKDKRLNALNMLKINTVTIQNISTTCMDFFTYYHTSYNMCRVPEFTLIVDEIPPELVLHSFISHPQRNKQETITSLEFIIDQTTKLQYVIPFLKILKRAIYLEKFSLTLVYNALGTQLEKDYKDNKPLCDNKCFETTIQNTVSELFKHLSKKRFPYLKMIEISDQGKVTINIDWKLVELSHFKPQFPYRFIYFESQ